MTNVKTGILVGDQRADALLLLTDNNGDGDALDAGERSVFFDETNASGLANPSSNIFSVVQAADKSVYVGDGNADAVFKLQDLNRDGDANDAGEAAVWFDANNADGLPLVTPNGIAQGSDGAIYITNAGTGSAPADAVYRTVDLNGDGDANDTGEATVWLDMQTIQLATGTAIGSAAVPFDIVFDGDVAYVNDLTGGDIVDIIHRVEDANGDGVITPDKVTPFITDAMNFGAPVDLTSAVQGDSLLTLTWFPDSSDPDAQSVLYRLTDLDGSQAIDRADEAAEVWNASALPDGFDMFVGFHVEADEDGNVFLTSDENVVSLSDRNGDGDYLDAGETQILSSPPDDVDARPRTLATYEETVPLTATTVGGGNHFSLFLDADTNTLYATGENVLGQLGNGVTGYDIKTPLPVTMPEDFDGQIASVSAGLIHGSFLTEDGDVYSWGFGNFGRLGHGDSENQLIPKKIDALDDATIVQIENGNGASYAIDDAGTLYAWGQNSNGQLGLGDETNRDVPTVVTALADETVVDISSGTSHTVVLTADGDVYAFGSNTAGQIGSPEGLDDTGEPVREVLSPVRVEGLPENVVSVTADTRSSFAVTADGKLYGWGENSFGQIGIGTDNGDGTFTPEDAGILVPTQIQGLPDTIVDVKAGARWVVALTEDGDVYAWGPNDEGPTGGLDGDPASESDGSFFPTLIAELDDVNVVEIATGPNSIIAVADTGETYTFGSNPDGRLGFRSDGTVYQPTLVDFSGDADPFLVTTTPADNEREVDADASLTFTFTEDVFAGDGTVRLVNRDDPSDVREIDIHDDRFVTFDGDTVTVTPSAFFEPDARYAVEFDTGAFVDADGNPVIGFQSGDTSSYNFQISDAPVDADITENGTRQSDLLRGGDGDDTLRGKRGEDALFGNDGDDRLFGNRDDDELWGGDGDDRLKGGSGDDLLDGGSGNDRLWGGDGEDTFVFRSDSGHDVIEDFETALLFCDEDRLRLDIDGVDSKWDLLRHIDRDGRDLVFDFDDETSLRLKDTSFLDFIKMDIDFV